MLLLLLLLLLPFPLVLPFARVVSDAIVEVDEVEDADDEDAFLLGNFLLLLFVVLITEFEHSRSRWDLFTLVLERVVELVDEVFEVGVVSRAKIASIENELHLKGVILRSFGSEEEESRVTLSSIPGRRERERERGIETIYKC